MKKQLNIDGVKATYEAIDCKDKLIIVHVPYAVLHCDPLFSLKLKKIAESIKEECGAKKVIAMANDIDFETIDTIDNAIDLINGYIDELCTIKQALLDEEDNDEEDGNE